MYKYQLILIQFSILNYFQIAFISQFSEFLINIQYFVGPI